MYYDYEHEYETFIMRVLIATNMYPTAAAPYLGVFVRQQELSLRRLGVEVEVAAHIGRDSRWNYPRALPELVLRLRAAPFDLIHSHHTYSTVLALAARRLARARTPAGRPLPIVETFHESEVFQRGTRFNQDALKRMRHWLGLKAWALRRVDFAIPVQRDMLRVVLGADAGAVRSRVIPAGIALDRFTPEHPAAARQRLGWDPAQTVIFFPCDPGKPEKRHDLAQAAFHVFAHAHPGARLVTGGAVPYDLMPDYLKAADVILHPTDYEASPTVIKEALACERPVVATGAGDVRECYGDLPGVLLCDWDAADIARKLETALAIRTPYGGRQRLIELELDLDQVARRVLRVYEDVMGSRQSKTTDAH